MGADMLISAASAPVYRADANGVQAPVDDHAVLFTRVTPAVINDVIEIIAFREDHTFGVFIDDTLTEEQLHAFDVAYDSDDLTPGSREAIARELLDALFNTLFSLTDDGSFGGHNPEVAIIDVPFGYRTRVLLVSGGLSWGDQPTDASAPIDFLGELALFDEPFTADGDEVADPDDRNLEEIRTNLLSSLALAQWSPSDEAAERELAVLARSVADHVQDIEHLFAGFLERKSDR
ncbi:hypothetical protein SAMN06295974_3730 [Plantibacter flavus]|uniref:Uncharacterized protein n=1 Tax=Plantibacter flavus TaxID=150123 RepID=A0A3N2BLS7_9MICO|nr:hypothetical protein [Plantibacter flavus]ROR76122.1 hypothetical protein EDD42_4075 [Plantibacter flavus]SMG48419.1 hypothetical protein SAMN06295974_3730 [Plantibacter flavus]